MQSWFGINVFVCVLLCVLLTSVRADRFPLSIIHINDLHARYESTEPGGEVCTDNTQCMGGYARTVYTVKRLLKELNATNPVYFNAGDSFQGTLWYNIGRWNVTTEMLNLLPADAMTLGNHEFDDEIEGLIPFLDTINTEMLVANMDARNEPTLQGKYKNSTIIVKDNRKIGVIGVILQTTDNIASTGKLIFHNESVTILEEAAKLKEQGANIIIVLSHCGYDVDKIIAEQAGSVVDVIVGSHSHTFLYTGENLPGPEKPAGNYPTEVIHKSGHRVLIVQASSYARYVGNLTVYFDDDGNVVDFEGAPIYMNAEVPEDEETVAAIAPWKEIVDKQGNVVVGETRVELQKSPCSNRECNLGNFYTDAMIYAAANEMPYEQSSWTNASIGLAGTGGLRVAIFKGNITYAQMIAMAPFENDLATFTLTGDKLLEALEFSVSKIDLANGVTSSAIYLQVSGLKVTYDYTKPVGQRVVKLKVRCSECAIPIYEDFKKDKLYRIVAPNFLADGGDGFTMFANYATEKQYFITDIEALLLYTKAINPIFVGNENRIIVSNF